MKLIEQINKTPTAFHAAANIKEILKKNGYTELFESEKWRIDRGGKYFVIRNLSSVIAFEVPEAEHKGLMICASHTDSPSFRLKSSPELPPVNGIIRLNIEGYGGMLKETWFDRPLSVAGRIAVSENGTIREYIVDAARDMVIIPSLAIHMGKPRTDANVNVQTEMPAIFRSDESHTELVKVIADSAGVRCESIISCDLYLYNRQPGAVLGAEGEFFSSARIDDLACVYLSLSAFVRSERTGMLKIFAAFDNEETGSLTRQGAESTFFTDTMTRINHALGVDDAEYGRLLASSFMLSADNAHAAHPNYMSKADEVNRPRLNGGVVLKFNASGKYMTDAVSAAVVRTIAQRADVPLQDYHNRSDIAGGSTLGNLMNHHISVRGADIGMAQLAMHSAYETAGIKDAEYMERLITEFYSSEMSSEMGTILRIS